MQDIIDLLREADRPAVVPLDLPDDDLLVEIEEQILISLPWEFRQFLLNVSDITCGHLEPVTVADARSHTFLPEVTTQAWSKGMPREWIAICEYPDGYAYVAQDETVGKWPQEGPQWETIWHWAQEEWLPG